MTVRPHIRKETEQNGTSTNPPSLPSLNPTDTRTYTHTQNDTDARNTYITTTGTICTGFTGQTYTRQSGARRKPQPQKRIQHAHIVTRRHTCFVSLQQRGSSYKRKSEILLTSCAASQDGQANHCSFANAAWLHPPWVTTARGMTRRRLNNDVRPCSTQNKTYN